MNLTTEALTPLVWRLNGRSLVGVADDVGIDTVERRHERPWLPRFPFFLEIVVDVHDGTVDCLSGVEEHLPMLSAQG